MHHGSQNGKGVNTVSWFSDMGPEYVVINGALRYANHPADGTLNNINHVTSVDELYITGEHGRVSFTVVDDDAPLSVENETGEPSDPGHWAPSDGT
jgi:beta-lactamase superfamily II metal-dependent hydrolase